MVMFHHNALASFIKCKLTICVYLYFSILFKDKKELLEEWTPEPLVPNYEPKESIINPRVIDG